MLNFSWLTALAQSNQQGKLGAGVIIGEPTGPTIKYWSSDKTAWDLVIGFQEDLSLHGDVLFHGWDVFPQPDAGRVGGYLGIGAKFQERKDDALFGIRFVGGVSYWTQNYPIEIIFELAPVFILSPETDSDIEGGIGLRYYF
jgi:hypothetical protein